MAGRARSRPALQVRGQVIDEELADCDVLGRQFLGVALQESRPERGHQHDQKPIGLNRIPVQPIESCQIRCFPAWCMKPSHFLQRGGRHLGAARFDLVALPGADNVLQNEGEPSRPRFHLSGEERRHPRRHPVRHFLVEANLDLVGPQSQAGGPALLVGRRELAHHTRRSRVGPVIGQRQTSCIGHLPGADGRRRHPNDSTVGQCAGTSQHLGDPFRSDVGGRVNDVWTTHGNGDSTGKSVGTTLPSK